MMTIDEFIKAAIAEDVGIGDHTSMACIQPNALGNAKLLVKEDGIAAGIELAEKIFHYVDPRLKINVYISDGMVIKSGDIILEVTGSSRSILTAERLVLNCTQRMSGIATLTSKFLEQIKGTKAKLLDTRKTTPLFRYMEKWAVRIGGGYNHRFGLFDMIMIKDNHVDYAGGIKNAIVLTNKYIKERQLSLKIEIETRSLQEVKEVMDAGNVDRIMFDNFNLPDLRSAVLLIHNTYETEASGGITLNNIRSFAETGVDYISSGALTHSAPNLDLSLKAFN